jgi:diacylglycerol kinase family enzyme
VLLIWNPVSSGVDAESVGVVSVRAAEEVDLTTRHTIAEGDAKRIAAEAPDAGYDAVFVLGGDGTANEVVNGLGDRLPIGVLPAGGTSVLPRALGLSEDLVGCTAELCQALIAGRVRDAALGTLNGSRFAFAAGIGLDAEIVRRVDARGRGGDGIDAKRPGDLWFLTEAVSLLLNGEYAESRMLIEGGGESFRAMTAFVANTDPWSFAGPLPLRIAPEAELEDGLSLVAIVKPIEARSSVERIRSLLHRGGEETDSVHRLDNLEHARIVCDEPTPVQVDGELLDDVMEIELGMVKPGARFLVPPADDGE